MGTWIAIGLGVLVIGAVVYFATKKPIASLDRGVAGGNSTVKPPSQTSK